MTFEKHYKGMRNGWVIDKTLKSARKIDKACLNYQCSIMIRILALMGTSAVTVFLPICSNTSHSQISVNLDTCIFMLTIQCLIHKVHTMKNAQVHIVPLLDFLAQLTGLKCSLNTAVIERFDASCRGNGFNEQKTLNNIETSMKTRIMTLEGTSSDFLAVITCMFVAMGVEQVSLLQHLDRGLLLIILPPMVYRCSIIPAIDFVAEHFAPSI